MCEVAIIMMSANGWEAGDAVEVMPDGTNWGAVALATGIYRMLKLPNVSLAMGRSLLEPDAYTSQADAASGRALKRRRYQFKPPLLVSLFNLWWIDGLRLSKTYTITDATDANFLTSYRSAK